MENNSPSKDIIKSIEENTAKRIATDVAIGERNQAAIMEAQAESNANAHMVNQTLHQGFGDLSYGLNRVTKRLDRVNRRLDKGFGDLAYRLDGLTDTVQKSAIMVYAKLDAMHKTLKTPRKTAAWELYQDAQENFDKELYEEARDQLLKAVELHNENYAVWFLLGKIYYTKESEFGVVVFDLDAAIAAFSNAVKYITPDARAHEELRMAAAVHHAYLGIVRREKMDNLLAANGGSGGEETGRLLDGALRAFEQSWAYQKILDVLYQVARCKALRGDKADALAYLETLITADCRYEILTNEDRDFDVIHDDYNRLIEKMRTDLYRKARDLSAEIQSVYAKAQADGITRYFPGGEITEINRFISEGISADLPYLDMRERSESHSSFLTRLKGTVHEAEAAKRRAEEEAKRRAEEAVAAVEAAEAEKIRAAEAAANAKRWAEERATAEKKRRRKHHGHIILWVLLYLLGSIALIGGGLALMVGPSISGKEVSEGLSMLGVLMFFVFFPIVGGLVGYGIGDDHHPVLGVIVSIAATVVCGVIFTKNQIIGGILLAVLWVVGVVLVTRVKTRNDDGYGKNRRK